MMRKIEVEAEFKGLAALPRTLRTAACVSPVVTIRLPSREALVLARRLEAEPQVVVVTPPAPRLVGLMAGAFWLGAVAAAGMLAVGL